VNDPSEQRKVYPPLLWYQRERFLPPPAAPALRAPLPWPREACFIAADAAQAVAIERYGWFQSMPVAMPASFWLGRLRRRLEADRAEALGLASETAPRGMPDPLSIVPGHVLRLALRSRGVEMAPLPWPRQLAQSIIRELERRRAWGAGGLRSGR
jgi:hypothetical protein